MKNVGIQLETLTDGDYDLSIIVRKDGLGRIVSGLTVGDVTYQNQAIILRAHKGEIKENPLVGVGLGDACNDEDFRLWKREIIEQLENDGQQIETLIFNEKEFLLEAKYK
jgi:sulfopyruvate decarboxylase TPP-binding subunit